MKAVLWILLLGGLGFAAEPQVLIGWEFDKDGDLRGWTHNDHVADVKVAGGCLVCRVTNWDPIFISPTFDIPARHSQWIAAKIRASEAGEAEFFWSGTLQGQYGGFSPGKQTPFQIVGGDGQWRLYRIRPFWEPERKIVHLRLDLPGGKGRYELGYVRIYERPWEPPVSTPVWEFTEGPEGWNFGVQCTWPLVAVAHDGWLWSIVPAGKATDHHDKLFSPPLSFAARERLFVMLRAKTYRAGAAALRFATDAESGLHKHPWVFRADGEPHVYLLDMSADPHWRGTIRLLGVEWTNQEGPDLHSPPAEVELDFIRILERPEGPPEMAVSAFGLGDAMPRAGQSVMLAAVLANQGAGVARNVQATLGLPQGLTTQGPPTRKLGDLWYGETRLLEWPVEAKSATSGTAGLSLTADGLPPIKTESRVEIGPSLGLPKADYVPEPKPAKSDYQVGAYYFPGWKSWASWRPIADYPERKPILGWYDESKPEIADWQIKWAVEHGISFFAVDWYWSQGARPLEHWLHDAYLKSRYRRFLKFCLLWANHNPPKTSSEADLLAVTDFWIQNYFKLPEYLTVDRKPVVIIFSTHRFTEDMGSPAVATAFAKMRERCRAAGLPGLYLIACAGGDRGSLERLKAEGYDAVSGYNYPSLNNGGKQWSPYADQIDGYKKLWQEAADAKLLPEIPVLSGGWDSRPWHGQKALVRNARTPALFERHCRDAKAFLDSFPLPSPARPYAPPSPARPYAPRGDDSSDAPRPPLKPARPYAPRGDDSSDAPRPPLKLCLIEAWNEWGEGSYIEPHREFGFGYLDAVRRVFASDSPQPPEISPRDIGLGTYDCPRPDPSAPPKTAWDFAKPADRADWNLSHQIAADPNASLLKGTATGNDPIIQGPVIRIPAEKFPWLCVEMRTTQPDTVQLFWSTTTAGVCENNSIRIDVPGDGQFHEHRVDLRRTLYWTGLITGLRLDPANKPGVAFEIRSLRFSANP